MERLLAHVATVERLLAPRQESVELADGNAKRREGKGEVIWECKRFFCTHMPAPCCIAWGPATRSAADAGGLSPFVFCEPEQARFRPSAMPREMRQ